MDIRAIMAKLNVRFVLGFIAIVVSVVSSQTLEVPIVKQLSVERGRNLTLECPLDDTNTRCTLIDSQANVVVDRHDPKKNRFEILNTKTCVINIHGVQLTDNQLYKCNAGNKAIHFDITVFATPNEPGIFLVGDMIKNESHNVVHVSPIDPMQSVQIECRSSGGYPNATINWFVNNELKRNDGEDVTLEQNGLLNMKSYLNVSFADVIHGFNGQENPEKEVRCEVDHVAYNSMKKVLIAFFGKEYDTGSVILKTDPSKDKVLVEPREVTCWGNGLPVPDDYKIMRETDVKGEYEEIAPTATFNITKPGVYLCKARNKNKQGILMAEYVISESVTFMDPAKAGHRAVESNVGSIVGIVLGTIVAIAIVVIVVALLYRREKLCFASSARNQQFSPNPSNVENGVKNVYESDMTNSEKDQKKDGVKGDQNENTKPKEVVYAQLDLTQKTNNGNSRPKSPEEKTEYAQLTFQPKENQV